MLPRKINRAIIEQTLHLYPQLGKLKEFYRLGGLQGQTYQIVIDKTASTNYILKLYPTPQFHRQRLLFEVSLMHALAQAGFPVAQPFFNIRGETLTGVRYRGHLHFALITTFLPGHGRWRNDLMSGHIKNGFALLARLHRFLITYHAHPHREEVLLPKMWQRIGLSLPRLLPCNYPGLKKDQLEVIEESLSQLRSAYPALSRLALSAPKQLIYGDLNPSNIFYADGEISGVFDLGLVNHGFTAWDLANSFVQYINEADALEPDQVYALGWQSYQKGQMQRPGLCEEFVRWLMKLNVLFQLTTYLGRPRTADQHEYFWDRSLRFLRSLLLLRNDQYLTGPPR